LPGGLRTVAARKILNNVVLSATVSVSSSSEH
jgi:hypothetical protein